MDIQDLAAFFMDKRVLKVLVPQIYHDFTCFKPDVAVLRRVFQPFQHVHRLSRLKSP